MITYNVRQARGVTVVDLSGRITISERTASQPGSALHELVRDLVKQGCRSILLNLRDVTYVDSSGLGELIGCLTTVQSQGGVLKLSNPTERVENLLRLTHLHAVLEVLPDESTAIRSFPTAGAA